MVLSVLVRCSMSLAPSPMGLASTYVRPCPCQDQSNLVWFGFIEQPSVVLKLAVASGSKSILHHGQLTGVMVATFG